MKAKIDVNEAIIKQALLEYFKKMNPSGVTLKASARYDGFDRLTGSHDISGTVEVELGDAVAQS
jgi:hypothetical protein